MFALHIVNLLVIIDFLLVESTSQISLTQKIANFSNLQYNFFLLLKSMIGYSKAISFECHPKIMQIPFIVENF